MTSISNTFDDSFGAGTQPRVRADVTACILQLFAFSLGGYPADKAAALAQKLAAAAGAFDWSNLDPNVVIKLRTDYDLLIAGICAKGVAPKAADACLWNAVKTFLDGWQNGDEPTYDFFQRVVDAMAEIEAEATPAPAPQKSASELFQAGFVSRVFEVNKFSLEVAAALKTPVVHFMGSLLGESWAKHEMRGFGFDNGTDKYHVLLETGEFLTVPAGSLAAAESYEAEDYDAISPTMLLALQVASRELELNAVIDHEQSAGIRAGKLGKFLRPHMRAVWSGTGGECGLSVEAVFEQFRASSSAGVLGTTGPVGASVRFAVPDTPYTVILDTRIGKIGPYLTSRLVRIDDADNETVVMRNDTPRLFTALGVYLFPLPDQLISLTILP